MKNISNFSSQSIRMFTIVEGLFVFLNIAADTLYSWASILNVWACVCTIAVYTYLV